MLAPGTQLGPYRIVAALGAGGMGEVYRAHDSRLGRDVAIKVLPARSLLSIDARARFEREARTISQLSHPHICTLYDVGREGETEFLVMELLEGETLSSRIARGPLPVADVLRLGAEIASALDRAHAAGVVHRDLKPGNVMLTKTGAKLMDFGLARVGATPASSSGAALSVSPTQTQPLTSEGAIVGTFQYMAPEQLEGREADARADIWALGCVLYEMATGKRAFAGGSQASLISAILRDEPRAMSELAPLSPPALQHVVARCLAKDPADRWQSARDVAGELRWMGESGSSSGVRTALAVPHRHGTPAWLPLTVALLALAAATLAALAPRFAARPPQVPFARFEIAIPEGLALREGPALSPDGRWLAFVAEDSSSGTRLWLRSTATAGLKALAISDADHMLAPFWSPDSRNVAYFAGGKLVRMPVDGSVPTTICDAPDGRGGSWGRGDMILFTPNATAWSGIWRVPAGGGVAVAVTRADSVHGERGHRYPCFLPDGDHFLYVSESDAVKPGMRTCWLASLHGGAPRRLFESTSAAVYAPPGWIVYRRDSALVAQGFDPHALRLMGEPRVLGSAFDVWSEQSAGAPTFSAGASGLLVCEAGGVARDRLFWFDRAGHVLGAASGLLPSANLLTLSPDSRQVVYGFNGVGGGEPRLWRVDLTSGLGSSLTIGRDGWNGFVWSPDARRVYFEREAAPHPELWSVALDGSEPERKVFPPADSTYTMLLLNGCTPDGVALVVGVIGRNGHVETWAAPVAPTGPGRALLSGPSDYIPSEVSSDGRLLAFLSNETGSAELYVTTFPNPGTHVRVSSDGLTSSAGCGLCEWVRGGRELVFVTPNNRVMAAEVASTPEVHVSPPRELFRLPRETHAVGASRDGERFLLALPGEAHAPQHFTVLVNWQNGEAK